MSHQFNALGLHFFFQEEIGADPSDNIIHKYVIILAAQRRVKLFPACLACRPFMYYLKVRGFTYLDR